MVASTSLLISGVWCSPRSVEELVAFVEERGLDLVDGPRTLFGARGTGQGLYVRDPEGNVVELRTYR